MTEKILTVIDYYVDNHTWKVLLCYLFVVELWVGKAFETYFAYGAL